MGGIFILFFSRYFEKLSFFNSLGSFKIMLNKINKKMYIKFETAIVNRNNYFHFKT